MDKNSIMEELLVKLEILSQKQESFSKDILALRQQINQLKNEDFSVKQPDIKEDTPSFETTEQDVTIPLKNPEPVISEPEPVKNISPKPEVKSEPVRSYTVVKSEKSNLERFIGENLISKIGIIITIIGIAIGVKYSIDRDLITPVTRIILGYVSGLVFLGIGLKLRKKYENFSAVLVSGAMAVMYFITFAAYDFYNMYPLFIAFGLMVLFTVFTVYIAIKYDKQVIANIGLVGAYAIPFLLSENTGNVSVLFSYMSIINIGILFISFKKYWESLYYSSFTITWLICLIWFIFSYDSSLHFGLSLTFFSIFFIIFFTAFFAYKLYLKQQFIFGLLFFIANAFIYYILGYIALNENYTGSNFLGLFTFINALLYMASSLIAYKQKDTGLFNFLTGLAVFFLISAILVQFNGIWVTFLWMVTTAILYIIGKYKNLPVYEKTVYVLIPVSAISLLYDWIWVYSHELPFNNICFYLSLLYAGMLGVILYLEKKTRTKENFTFSYLAPAIIIFTIYIAFFREIVQYFHYSYNETYDYSPALLSNVWLNNFILLYITMLHLLNYFVIKSRKLGVISLCANILILFIFLASGLYCLSELREFNINTLRYVSITLVALNLYTVYLYINKEFRSNKLIFNSFEVMLNTVIIWIASSELLHWMDIGGASQSYKLGLSILWGAYSVLLIGYGIWKNKKHLRIAAICLFCFTLLKLFFYDISHLNTLSKTVVFVSLGSLLLFISFLYNKYRKKIADEPENDEI